MRPRAPYMYVTRDDMAVDSVSSRLVLSRLARLTRPHRRLLAEAADVTASLRPRAIHCLACPHSRGREQQHAKDQEPCLSAPGSSGPRDAPHLRWCLAGRRRGVCHWGRLARDPCYGLPYLCLQGPGTTVGLVAASCLQPRYRRLTLRWLLRLAWLGACRLQGEWDMVPVNTVVTRRRGPARGIERLTLADCSSDSSPWSWSSRLLTRPTQPRLYILKACCRASPVE